jgi:hypothetical protein
VLALDEAVIKLYAFAEMQTGLRLIDRTQWHTRDLWVAREIARIRRSVGYTVVLVY